MKKSFLIQWGEAMTKLKSILAYLQADSGVVEQLGMGAFIKPQELDREQSEWIRLLDRLEDKREHSFFRQHWVPVVKDSLFYFIDLSCESFPLFQVTYLYEQPRQWVSQALFTDISELLLAADHGLDQEGIRKREKQERLVLASGLFDEEIQLALAGSVEVEAPGLAEILQAPRTSLAFSCDGSRIDLEGITPQACGLIPLERSIRMLHLDFLHGESFYELQRIRCIRDLVFLVRHLGAGQVHAYAAEFASDGHTAFHYKDGRFRFWYQRTDDANALILAMTAMNASTSKKKS